MTKRVWATAAAVLLLAGCKDQPSEQVSDSAGESLSAQSIGSNDSTAIDAVTNDAANMAADVEYNLEDEANGDAADNAAAPTNRDSDD